MKIDSVWLSGDGTSPLFLRSWAPPGPPRAVVLVLHGMAEHSGRYARFAAALCSAGIAVFAHDQRGHGETAGKGLLGHYADNSGWSTVIDDVSTVLGHIHESIPGCPVFLFAHSMGSYIAQGFLIRRSESVQGAILSGSNYQSIWLYKLAKLVVRIEAIRLGAQGKSSFFNRLTFGEFNRAVSHRRTEVDWLSRDPVEVDRYIADPLCGNLCTNQLWMDLLSGLVEISRVQNLSRIRSELPLLVLGGSCDPVSDGHRLQDLRDALVSAGMRHAELKIYPEARHELLNETNRNEATSFVLSWLEKWLSSSVVRGPEADETLNGTAAMNL